MAISDSQKVDLLFKKVGYGVSKTDTSTYKGPTGEANASPMVSPGITVYQQDYAITNTTTLPTSNSSVVTIYRDSLSSTVQCTKLPTTSANVSWTTGMTDWVPVQYGTGYQVKLYAGPPGSVTPQNYTSLPAGGSGNNDDWNFDYQAGIVNFADTNVPTAASAGGNVVYVVGARYTGVKGITTFANLQIANISINGNTISATGNTITISNLQVSGTDVYANISSTASNVATLQTTSASHTVWLGNLQANVYSNANAASYLTTFNGNVNAGNVMLSGNLHTDYIASNVTSIVTFVGSAAIKLPVGNTSNRPTGVAGATRYNTDISQIEYYDGNVWVGVTNTVTDQTITGDDVNNVFTLDQTATQQSTLVSINGTLQQPGVAYTVNGTQITFAEVPLSTDVISIRFLGGVVSLNTTLSDDLTVSGNITLSGILSAPQTTKASNAPGTAGQICWDANYIYVCTAANTWKRSPLTGGY